MNAWQPIETAPTSTDVLLLCDEGVFQGKYETNYILNDPNRPFSHWYPLVLGIHGCGCCGGEYPTPTHWQPLPEPPRKDLPDER